jgi:hypothetical protein
MISERHVLKETRRVVGGSGMVSEILLREA